ncbi:MAG TPA: hypothetical protein VN132_02415, partial [Bdellovibrio sp.]|nr:hypothetical protein [Bdellovibrio sp.]
MKFFMPIFFLITLSATPLRDISAKKYLIVWNIGQGQWVTAVENDQCLHFDAGGEFFPWARLRELCGKKQNRFFLSHWDWDHIGALSHSQLLKTLPSSCIALRPLGKSSGRKMNILGSLPDCPDP